MVPVYCPVGTLKGRAELKRLLATSQASNITSQYSVTNFFPVTYSRSFFGLRKVKEHTVHAGTRLPVILTATGICKY